MTTGDIVGIVAIAISLFTFVYSIVKANRDKTEDAVKQLQVDVEKLKTQVEVFWRNVSYDAAKNLHTPHPENARRDYLLEQYIDEKITRTELVELVDMLNKVVNDDTNRDFGERQAASLLLRTIEQRFLFQPKK